MQLDLRGKIKLIEQVASDPERVFGLTGFTESQEMTVALVQTLGLIEILQEAYITADFFFAK